MDYSTLVDNVQACPKLKTALDEMTQRTRAINLVVPDWKSTLYDHPIYKQHTSDVVKYSKGHACSDDKAYVRNIVNPNQYYNVIVAGCFSIDAGKTNIHEYSESLDYSSFITRKSEPLTEMGLSMKENTQKTLNDGARLFIDVCDPMLCHKCASNHRKHRIPISQKNWCVLMTRIYNGHDLHNAFKSRLAPTLLKLSSFLAILNLQITSRTTFGDDCYKIGGRVKEMIIFTESTLNLCENLSFSSIEENVVPSIEFPEEDVEEAIPKRPRREE